MWRTLLPLLVLLTNLLLIVSSEGDQTSIITNNVAAASDAAAGSYEDDDMRTSSKENSESSEESLIRPKLSTHGSVMITKGSEIGTMTGSSGIEMIIHKHKSTKKPKTTTTESSEEPGSSTNELNSTTEESEIDKTTHKHKSTKTPKITTTESSEGPVSTTNESESTTEESEMEKTTHKHKSIKKPKTTTTASSEEPGSSTNESESTTEDSEMEKTTHKHKSTKKPVTTTTPSSEEPSFCTNEPESTIEESEMEKITHKHKSTKKPKTTTAASSEEPGSSTNKSESTAEEYEMEKTTHKHKSTKKHKTTTTATTTTDDSENTSASNQSESKTTDSVKTTTEVQSTTTTRGPKDCRGKNKFYYRCAPSCPQMSCSDYLKGTKCPINIGRCTPECRCLSGYLKDAEGNCLSARECKRAARLTTNFLTSSTTASPKNQESNAASPTLMMSRTPEPNCEDPMAYELFVKGNYAYTAALLYDLSLRNPGNNILVGGASILGMVAQLASGATGRTNIELLNLLNLDKEQIYCLLPEVSANLTAEYPDIEYSLFCKIYADVNFPLADNFIRSAQQVFPIGPENLNFSLSESAQKINDEVAQLTNNNFLKYIKPNMLASLDGFIMVDANNFQGKWERQFDPADTTIRDFYTFGKTDKLPTMYQEAIFLYTESKRLNAKVLVLKYRGGDFNLVIVLPNTINGLKDLMRRLQNLDSWTSAIESLTYAEVKISLPKFHISVANRLKVSSESAKLKQIFNNESTGLENTVSAGAPYISEILQKLTFTVDEFGMGDTLDIDFPVYDKILLTSKRLYVFNANHPFCYCLRYKEIVLKCGIFAR